MMPGLRKHVPLPFDTVVAMLPAALKSEGFGVLTEIDVRETLRQKLGVQFRPYKILGACNPGFAHRALETDIDAGVMLPCNVVVYGDGEQNTVVIAVDPMRTTAAGDESLRPIAEEVREKLGRVIASLP